MESAGLFALFGLAHDEIANVDDVAQLAYLARGLAALEELLGLLIEDVEAVPGAVEAQVGAHYADVCAHDLPYLLDTLGDEHHLLGVARSLVVPRRDIGAERVVVDHAAGVARRSVGIDDGLDQRVGRQAVAAVKAGARAFADGIQAADRRLAVGVDLDAATQVVGRGSDRDVVAGDVDAKAETVLINVGEMALGLLGVLVGDVEIDMIVAVELHLAVDGARHDVARSEREPRVILVHELLAAEVAEHGAISAHGLGDEERRAVAGMIEGRGMELDELHVLHCALGAVDHRDAVAGGDEGVGRGGVDGATAAGGHQCRLGQERVDTSVGRQHVGAIAGDVGRAAGDNLAQMVLGDDLDGKVVFKDVDVGTGADSLDEALLYLISRVVGMVENAELRVTALAVEVKVAVLLLVKIHAPLDELPDLSRGLGDNLADGLGVAQIVAGNHRVLDMLVKVVDLEIGDRGDTTLCQRRVCLVERRLADERHAALVGYLERETHPGNARADDEKIILSCHYA